MKHRQGFDEESALRELLREAHAADRVPPFEVILAGRTAETTLRRRGRPLIAWAAAAAAAVLLAFVLVRDHAPPGPTVTAEVALEGELAGIRAPESSKTSPSERLDLASARLLVASLTPQRLPATPFGGGPASQRFSGAQDSGFAAGLAGELSGGAPFVLRAPDEFGASLRWEAAERVR